MAEESEGEPKSDEHRPPNPFERKWNCYKAAEREFAAFKDIAEQDIPALIAAVPGFEALKAYCSFYVGSGRIDTIQARFGRRATGRLTVEGEMAWETGAALVYSFGPTGWVAAMLYPPESPVARVHEDFIYLHLKPASTSKLRKRLHRDLRDLVAYEEVASLDGDPTWAQRLRIWWLRYKSRLQIKGETTAPRRAQHARKTLEFSTAKAMTLVALSIMRPIGILIVAYLLIRYGMPDIADKLLPRGSPG